MNLVFTGKSLFTIIKEQNKSSQRMDNQENSDTQYNWVNEDEYSNKSNKQDKL